MISRCLPADLARSVEVVEHYPQKHLGHIAAEMALRYQRRVASNWQT